MLTIASIDQELQSNGTCVMNAITFVAVTLIEAGCFIIRKHYLDKRHKNR